MAPEMAVNEASIVKQCGEQYKRKRLMAWFLGERKRRCGRTLAEGWDNPLVP